MWDEWHQIQSAVERLCPTATSSRVVVVCINATAAEVQRVQQLVHGDVQPLSALAVHSDRAAIVKMYKITDAELLLPTEGGGGSALSRAVASRIAAK